MNKRIEGTEEALKAHPLKPPEAPLPWQAQLWKTYVRNEQGGARRNARLFSRGPQQAQSPPAPQFAPGPPGMPILPAFIVPLPTAHPLRFPPWEGHAHWGCKDESHTLLHPRK